MASTNDSNSDDRPQLVLAFNDEHGELDEEEQASLNRELALAMGKGRLIDAEKAIAMLRFPW